MGVKATMLFDEPQSEIASLIQRFMFDANSTSIVTGFATPDGIAALLEPIHFDPHSISSIVVGAATYPGFEALEKLLVAGVPLDRLRVHLGHTQNSGGHKHPVVRYHPMLHSKIYYMEFFDGSAVAFIGSHNVTSFALRGLNGEAAVLLEGSADESEFKKIREHIETAKRQAVPYSHDMKQAFAWWTREFVDGLRSETQLPTDWTSARTILIFATAASRVLPTVENRIYFEVPAEIQQIGDLSTEVHLFVFDSLPKTPWEAIANSITARCSFTCTTPGVDNEQSNLEVKAHWCIESNTAPVLQRVPSGALRPNTAAGMQQVNARVKAACVIPSEYQFDRGSDKWLPIYSKDQAIEPTYGDEQRVDSPLARPTLDRIGPWQLVTGLKRDEVTKEKDELRCGACRQRPVHSSS